MEQSTNEGSPFDGKGKPRVGFVKELIAAGERAPQIVVQRVITSHAHQIHADAAEQRSRPDFDVEAYVARLIKSQLMLARSEGAGGGLATTLAAMGGTVVAGPPGGIAAAGAAVIADLAALSWLQIRLSLMIGAAYGHDPRDAAVRLKEILALHNLETTGTKTLTQSTQTGAQRVVRRLLERYLRGPLLKSITAMFRVVGLKFSRAALIRGLPFLNVPINAGIADVTTRRTASKARKYYRELPPGGVLSTHSGSPQSPNDESAGTEPASRRAV